jgi:hypothetical protein
LPGEIPHGNFNCGQGSYVLAGLCAAKDARTRFRLMNAPAMPAPELVDPRHVGKDALFGFGEASQVIRGRRRQEE